MKRMTFVQFFPADEKHSVLEYYVDGTNVFDVTKNDAGDVVVQFHPAIVETDINCDELIECLAEGRRLAAQDEGVETGRS